MQSAIKKAIGTKHDPVAILWSDDKPEGAGQFKEGKWGCVMWMLAAAARGKSAAFDHKTYACWGGGVGLGFGDQYRVFPGGERCFHYFLSIGNEQWKQGQEMIEQMRKGGQGGFLSDFSHGEKYLKSPELVADFVAGLPIMEVPTR